MHCTNCGSNIEDGGAFCSSCGAKVVSEQAQQSVQTQPTSYNQAGAPVAPAQKDNMVDLNKPLSVGSYFWMLVLCFIPIVNIVMGFVWGFDSAVNTNRKNFGRAMLIMVIVMIGLWVILGTAIASLVLSFISLM